MQRLIAIPAVLATVGAIALGVVFGLIPAFSTTDYLNVSGVAPGASDGDLAILGEVSPGSLALGDTVAPEIPRQGRQLYSVLGLDAGMVLLGAATGPVVVAPESIVTRRLTSTVGGFGDLFGFVDTAHGWATIAASTLALWLIAAFVMRRGGSKIASTARPVAATSAGMVREVAAADGQMQPPPVAAPVPLPPAAATTANAAPEAAPPRQALTQPSDLAPIAAPISAEPTVDAPAPSGPAPRAAFDDPLLTLVREVAQQAPQAGLRHARRVIEIGPNRKAAGWAGLAATAAAVAAATYLVASERGQKKQRRRFKLL